MRKSKLTLASVKLIAVASFIILAGSACRHRSQIASDELQPEAEPEQYSATLVRTVVDGTSEQRSVTKEARSGELRREEWAEDGENRALILRLDLGKGYLLDLDRQIYVEIELTDGDKNSSVDSRSQGRENKDSTSELVQAVDRAIDDAQSPDRVETRALPSSDVDGHTCQVYERRATFVDGHVEIIKSFRATDLGGLILRSEASSEPLSVTIITERKDVSRDVAPERFTIPMSFRKVDKLDHR
jgi:hypothetical protein